MSSIFIHRVSFALLFLLVSIFFTPTFASPASSIRTVSLPIVSGSQDPVPSARFPDRRGPVKSASCGYARVSQVGISVNKGAHAVIRYKIRVKAVSSVRLANSDSEFFDALSEQHHEDYLSLRKQYTGGLDIPFLRFLGVDLDDQDGLGKRNPLLNDDEFRSLSKIATKIMTESTKQVIVARGRLKATGISCMTTTAYAFVKVAQVRIRGGKRMTVLTSNGNDVIAATKHADTLLPSEGSLRIVDL